jgi:hypothetical protein
MEAVSAVLLLTSGGHVLLLTSGHVVSASLCNKFSKDRR